MPTLQCESATKSADFNCPIDGTITKTATASACVMPGDDSLSAELAARNSARAQAEADAQSQALQQAQAECNAKISYQQVNNNTQIASLEGQVTNLQDALAQTIQSNTAAFSALNSQVASEQAARIDAQEITDEALAQQRAALFLTADSLTASSEAQRAALEQALNFGSTASAGQASVSQAALSSNEEVNKANLVGKVVDAEKESNISAASIIDLSNPVVRNIAISAAVLAGFTWFIRRQK